MILAPAETATAKPNKPTRIPWRLRRHTEAAARKLFEARIAPLNWRAETAELIASEAKRFASLVDVPMNVENYLAHRQVRIFSDSGAAVPRVSDGRPEVEKAASLLYSLHPNGTIAVIAYPHDSAGLQIDGAPFVIDVVEHPRQLAGADGRRRVRKDLVLFTRLALESRAHVRPTPATLSVMRAVERRAQRFRNIFESSKKAREERLKLEIAIGAGFAAGLLASAVPPLVERYLTNILAVDPNTALAAVLFPVLVFTVASGWLLMKLVSRR